MSKIPTDYLQHIQDEILFIISTTERISDKEKFVKDEPLKRAVVRSLEIIGEATKKIPADFKLKWDKVKWKEMAGMRHRLIYDYMGVNYSIVCDAIRNKIPGLHKQLTEVLK